MGRGQLFWIKWQHYGVTDTEMYCLAITFLNQNIFWWGKKKKTCNLVYGPNHCLVVLMLLTGWLPSVFPIERSWVSGYHSDCWLVFLMKGIREKPKTEEERLKTLGETEKNGPHINISMSLMCTFRKMFIFR